MKNTKNALLDALDTVARNTVVERASVEQVTEPAKPLRFKEPEMAPASLPKQWATSLEDLTQVVNTKDMYTCEVGDTCPHCGYGVLEDCISFAEKTSEFFVYCPICNAYIFRYKPMPHQEAFHADPHMKKLYAGGFGSAKTYTCGAEFLAYVLQVPNSAALVGAATWGQVADTCLKFIVENIPKALVAKSNQDKVSWYIDLVNGSRISAKALDKEGKIRSANLSIIWVEEASEVDYSVVTFIMARLRNKTANFKGKNRLKMLLSSNPDVNWLNTEWAQISDVVYYHGDIADKIDIDSSRSDPVVSTHISSTSCNTYLPAGYEQNLAKNKPQWWVNRYLRGSFKYTEGLVYPNFMDWLCDPFPIPRHWRRIVGVDFGRHDPTAYVLGAIDPLRNIIYFYKEIHLSLDDVDFSIIIQKIHENEKDVPDYLWAYPRQGDPRGVNRDQVSGRNWYELYLEMGIFIQPCTLRKDSLTPSILKTYSYGNNGKLKFFRTLTACVSEFKQYKYPTRTLGDTSNAGELPLEAHNHLPDAVRYAMAPLPEYPKDEFEFTEKMREFVKTTLQSYNPLSTEDDIFNAGYVQEFSDNFG